MPDPTYILDPLTTGHHPEYLRYLAEACGREKNGKAAFRFFVDASLVGELVELGVRVRSVPEGGTPADQLERVCEEARQAGARLFLPRVNTYLEPMLKGEFRGLKRHGTGALSGIWFGPQSASLVYGGSIGKKVRGLLEIMRIRRLHVGAGLHRLYLLNDPKTAAALSGWTRLPGGVHALADPVAPLLHKVQYAHGARDRLGLPDGRTTIFGMVGALREGKGVAETIRMLQKWKPPEDRNTMLLIAGEILPGYQNKLDKALNDFRATNSGVRLHTKLGRLSRGTFEDCLHASDFLLLPYRNVYNSSGLLGYSASIGIPLISSRDGLLGQLVRDFELGLTINPRSAKDLHRAMNAAMANRIRFDSDRADAYLQENSISAFQKTLMEAFRSP